MKKTATLKVRVEVELKDIGKERWGTSKQGELNATYAQLCQVFGPPNTNTEETSQDHKTDVEWQGLIAGEPFTIYNYKDGPRYLGQAGTPILKITDWHIGSHHARTAELVKAFFEDQQRRQK